MHWRKREMVKRRKSRPWTDRQLDGRAFALNKVFFHVMLYRADRKYTLCAQIAYTEKERK